MEKALLPAGFHDLLPPEAEKKAQVLSRLCDSVQKFGYELVDPPSIEFEDSLFKGAGAAFLQHTFRVMDPVSHKMMGVRCDITTQVARIAATRLKKQPKPLRLAYGGDIFRVKGEGLHAKRQMTQSGIELVGADSAAADAEIVLVMVRALSNLGIKSICIDFTFPRLVDIILDNIKIKDSQRQPLIDAINKKNIGEIAKLAEKDADILVQLAKPGVTLAELTKIKLPKAAKPLLARLLEVVEIVEKSGESIDISVDPSESSKFKYHTGIGFTIFARGTKNEIGRGGRYGIEDDGTIIPAIGATVYIDDILRILPSQKPKDRVFVPFGTKWDAVRKLVSSEREVICAVVASKDIFGEAKKQGCSFVLQDGKVTMV